MATVGKLFLAVIVFAGLLLFDHHRNDLTLRLGRGADGVLGVTTRGFGSKNTG